MDLVTMRSAFAGPGSDTRQWLSYGLVAQGEKSVQFTDEDGNVLPTGPLVTVDLQPSGITAPCRIASNCAGNEESEYLPFMPGDEVLVAIPEGDERAGCVIIGRLNQEIDKFPLKVAGQDVTKNTFGFKRLRTPYVIETASSFMIRSALTGAGLTIDQTGNLFLISGDGHKVVLHGSFMKLGSSDDTNFVQIDPTQNEVLLQAGLTTQLILAADRSSFMTTGILDIGTGGAGAAGHGVTVEQVMGIIANAFAVIVKALTPHLTSPPAEFASNNAFDTLMTAVVAACGVQGVPFNFATGGSDFSTLPATFDPQTGSIAAAISAAALVAPDPTGVRAVPGFGRASLMY